MSTRLVILTEIIAPYRIPVFNALAGRGDVDLHVIFLAETDPTMREWNVYKDEIRFSYEVLPSWRRRLGRYHLLLNWGLGRALRRASPEVILCGGYSYAASWRALAWANSHHLPFLLWLESTAYDRRNRYFAVECLKQRFLKQCDGVVVPGRSSQNYVRDFGIPESRIFTAPNAVDNDFFSQRTAALKRREVPPARKLPSRYFLFVGRLVPEKGVFDLLEAYAKLGPDLRAEVSLVFAGSGRAEQDLIARSKAIQPGTVLFAGFTQKKELADLYALADMLIFPTHTDTWGLVVNEAMACGLPVICTTVAGCAADLVQDQWNGRLVPPRDVVQLAAAMDALARNPQLRSDMGAHSRQKIALYSPRAWADGLAVAVAGFRRTVAHG
jgi:glycosyltransferase involved in cell wall biosynthesis